MVELVHGDCVKVMGRFSGNGNAVIVTDPPFNVGYHYATYDDRKDEDEYYRN